MTCIAGVVDGGSVWLAGDSAGVDGAAPGGSVTTDQAQRGGGRGGMTAEDLAHVDQTMRELGDRYNAKCRELAYLVQRLRPSAMRVGPISIGEWGYSLRLMVNGHPIDLREPPDAATMLRVLDCANDFERQVIESAARLVRPVLEAAERLRLRDTLVSRLEPEIGRDEAIVAVEGYLRKVDEAGRQPVPERKSWWKVWLAR